jgi:Ca2+-binding RTX toxin-like protein
MISFSFASFRDATGLYAGKQEALKALFADAFRQVNAVIVGKDVTIDFDINIEASLGGAYATGGDMGTGPVSLDPGRRTSLLTAVQSKIQTGVDTNGATPDAVMNLSAAFMNDLTAYLYAPFPSQQVYDNMVGTTSHEFAHALGFNGYLDRVSGKPQEALYQSRFDALTVVDGGAPYFIGQNAMTIYGGKVPLHTLGDASSIYHLSMPSALMYYAANGTTLETALEIAMLRDLGYMNAGSLASLDGHVYLPGAGSDAIVGTNRYEQVRFSGAKSSYAITTTPAGTQVIDADGNEGTHTVSNIEELVFADGIVRLAAPALASVMAGSGNKSFGESAGSAALTIRLTAPSERPVTVDYATVDGTAKAGKDYQATGGTLRFAPGETEKQVIVALLDDAAPESDETFSLTLSAPSGAILSGDSSAVPVWIREDDAGTPSALFASQITEDAAAGTCEVSIMGNAAVDPSQTISFALDFDTSMVSISTAWFRGLGGDVLTRTENARGISGSVEVKGASSGWELHFSFKPLAGQGDVVARVSSFLIDGKELAGHFAPLALMLGAPQSTDMDDAVMGTSGNDVLHGQGGNDVMTGGAGDDALHGGAGVDTALFSGARASYSITANAIGFTVRDLAGKDGQDTLVGMEQIRFSDATLSLQHSRTVQALYVGYFGRAADAGGWTNFQAALAGLGAATSLSELAAAYSTDSGIRGVVDAFGTSKESSDLYGAGDNRSFVTAIYHNVFNRDPDQGGLAFWAGALDQHVLGRARAALSIMTGALTNTTTQGLVDAALVNNKITIASDFTFALDSAPKQLAYAGNDAAAKVRDMLSHIDAGTDMLAAQSKIDNVMAELATLKASGAALAAPLRMDDVTSIHLVGIAGISGVTPEQQLSPA